MTVLIVDDSMYMGSVLMNLLVGDGHEIIGETGTGKEAVEIALALNPDLITLNNVMPDLNSFEVLKQVKEVELTSKVIMISAFWQLSMIEEASQLGVDSCITNVFSG